MAKPDKQHEQQQATPRDLSIKLPYSVNIRFPGDLEYIPAIRKFVAELLQVTNFTPRFAYRSEIIIDEICNNAVVYGCKTDDAQIDLRTDISRDHIEFTIKDQGGSSDNLTRLKRAISAEVPEKESSTKPGLGLEIVKMLSERMDVVIDENNLTSVRIVRKREGDKDKT